MRKKIKKCRQSALAEALEPRRLLAAELVYDINQVPGNNAGLAYLASVGSVAYFSANDGVTGLELWKTDGTKAGTSLVNDVVPGAASGGALGFVKAGAFTYFSTTDGTTGWELWKTDGTASGTSLVKDINPGPGNGNPSNLTAAGSLVYFIADDGVHGQELWRSDGTEAGTFLVKDIRAGSAGQTRGNPTLLGRSDGTVLFKATDGTSTGNGMWKSDGTAGGTSIVFAPSYNNGVYNLTASGSRVYFTDGLGYVYATDGTTANTIRVDSTNSSVSQMVDVGGTLYYYRKNGQVLGLRSTDTSPFTVTASATYQYPTGLASVNNVLYVAATDDSTGVPEILKVTAGSSSATVVRSWNVYSAPTIANLTGVGSTLYFTAWDSTNGYVLWKSGGTSGTTSSLKALYNGSTSSENVPNAFVAVGSRLVFINGDGTNTGPAIWASDGTIAGTGLVRDVYPGTESSGAYPLAEVNNLLLLRADDSTSGSEIWVTDGTPGHMSLLKDINPGSVGSNVGNVFTWGSLAYFGTNSPQRGSELWATDGTTAGTVLLKAIDPSSAYSIASGFTPFNGRLYFVADDAAHGQELWSTDGTPGGTTLVMDLYAGASDGVSGELTVFNGGLYFVGNDGSTGRELWKTDGTPGGTSIVKDIYAGSSGSSSPTYLTVSNGVLYFRANDGTRGAELWVSDGTTAGTALLKDLYAGSSSSNPVNFTSVGALTYFTATDSRGTELWVTDGTAAGTVFVADINPGTSSGSPRKLAAVNGRLLFVATGADTSDHVYSIAAPGQTPVTIGPGGYISNISTLVRGDRYFYSLDDGVHGAEMWVSDGTATGTYMVQDLRPGWIGDTYGPFFPFHGTVYFQGDDGITFWELYRLVPPTANAGTGYVVPPGSTLVLNGSLSSDPDGLPLTYTWDLDGDGIFGETGPDAARGDETGPTPTFSAAGLADKTAYSVRLRVTNPTGIMGEASAIVNLILPPSATFAVPSTVNENSSVTVSFSAPAGTGPFTYSYDFNNDGTFEIGGSSAASATVPVSFFPDGPASRLLRGRITDTSTGLFAEYIASLTVLNVAPTATFGDPTAPHFSGDNRSPVEFAFTSPVDSPADVAAGFTYSFDLDNDGTFEIVDSASSSSSKVFPAAGTYTVRGQIKDKDGGVTVYTRTVSITAAPVNVSGISFHDANGNGVKDVGETSFSSLQIYADLNNNGVKDAGEPSATPTTSGSYSLSLTPGTYTIRTNVNTSSYLPTAPAAGSYTVTVTNEDLSGYDFGTARKGTAVFVVFVDENGDGLLSPGEVADSERMVYADINNNGVKDTGEPYAVTNASGIAMISLFPGTYSFRLQLWNDEEQTVPARNQPATVMLYGGQGTPTIYLGLRSLPFVWISGTGLSVGENLAISLRAHSFSDRTVVDWEWDFDYDGSSFQVDAVGSDVTFSAYGIDGPATRTVAARVRDSAGAVSLVDTTTVSIFSRGPSASFANSGPVNEGATSATVSFQNITDSPSDLAAGYTFSYDFDNDGTFDFVARDTPTATVPARYLADGPFTRVVHARVTDREGTAADFYTSFPVYNVSPTLSVAPVVDDGSCSLLLSASDPGQDTIVSWTVDWGDGTKQAYPGAAPTPSHTYTTVGTRTILVTATDEDGTFGATAAAFALDTSFSGDGKDAAILGATERLTDVAIVSPIRFISIGWDKGNATITTLRFDSGADNSVGHFVDTWLFDGFIASAARPEGGFVLLASDTDATTGGVDARVIRFGADGLADMEFIFNADYPVVDFGSPADVAAALAIASDGSVFVGGANGAAGTSPKFAVAKLTPTGQLDPTFGIGGIALYSLPGSTSACVNALSVLPDGRILAAITGGAGAPLAVARFNADGSLDATFGGGSGAIPGVAQYALASGAAAAGSRHLEVLPDGRFLVASYGGKVVSVTRFLTDGLIDPSFGSSASGSVYFTGGADVRGVDLAVGPGGRISVVFNDGNLTRVANLTAAGLPDAVLGSQTYAVSSGSDEPVAIAASIDGRLVLAVNGAGSTNVGGTAVLASGAVPVAKTIVVSQVAGASPGSGPVDENMTAVVAFAELLPDRSAVLLKVTYTDNESVDPASLDDNDLSVTGPGGAARSIHFIASYATPDGHGIFAFYEAAAPYSEGLWEWQDNGTYTVSLLAGAVTDNRQNSAPAGPLGTFDVQIATPVAPDLVPTFVGAAPKTLKNGAKNRVTIKVKNGGNRNLVAANVTTRLYFSSDPILDTDDRVLGTITQKLTIKTTAARAFAIQFLTPAVETTGKYYLLLKSDVTNAVAERNERNNVASAGTTATASYADLAVSIAKKLKPTYTAGTKLPLSVKLSNVGSSAYAGNVAVSFLFSDDPIADTSDVTLFSATVKALVKPKGNQRFNFNTQIPANVAGGHGYLIVRIEPLSADHNAANNTQSSRVAIP